MKKLHNNYSLYSVYRNLPLNLIREVLITIIKTNVLIILKRHLYIYRLKILNPESDKIYINGD
ncbi:hypothetical protein A8M50_00630 [Haemophilus haemolyticus]|nr:hypothetical protein A8M50_00630 [Haemophilus haemolyticus]